MGEPKKKIKNIYNERKKKKKMVSIADYLFLLFLLVFLGHDSNDDHQLGNINYINDSWPTNHSVAMIKFQSSLIKPMKNVYLFYIFT